MLSSKVVSQMLWSVVDTVMKDMRAARQAHLAGATSPDLGGLASKGAFILVCQSMHRVPRQITCYALNKLENDTSGSLFEVCAALIRAWQAASSSIFQNSLLFPLAVLESLRECCALICAFRNRKKLYWIVHGSSSLVKT